ncbi:MAG: response regulator transcription factor [Frankiales bacterium]|jgi:DNA-binding NarL/FixJ family response regulator|nr:response regulator transcription factor [Frankiales bacterium]
MPRKTRSVLIVDDNEVARTVAVHMIRRDPKFRVRGTAHDGLAAIDLAEDECPDLIVLDQQMPGSDADDVIPRLRELCPEARIVVWGNDPTLRGMTSPVDGFVSKAESPERLMDWLRAA